MSNDFVQELRRTTFPMVYRMVGSVAEAEDLIQEGLLRFQLVIQKGTTRTPFLSRLRLGLQSIILGPRVGSERSIRENGFRNRSRAISNVSTFCGIAKQKSVLDDTGMNTKTRRPRVGDLVGISGFLGRFEVIQVGLDGAMTDLKHLGSPGPDYIERDILSHELIYLNAQKLDPSANRSGERVSSR